MKRSYLFILFLVFTLTVQATSPWFPAQSWKWKPWGAGISLNKVFTDKDLEATNGRAFGLEVLASGVYLSLGGNFDSAQHENQYGGGQVSSRHPITTFAAGYNYMFYYNGSIRLGIIPLLSLVSVDDRLEDLYYGETKIVNTTNSWQIGLGFALSTKTTSIVTKVAPNIWTLGFLINI